MGERGFPSLFALASLVEPIWAGVLFCIGPALAALHGRRTKSVRI